MHKLRQTHMQPDGSQLSFLHNGGRVEYIMGASSCHQNIHSSHHRSS